MRPIKHNLGPVYVAGFRTSQFHVLCVGLNSNDTPRFITDLREAKTSAKDNTTCMHFLFTWLVVHC